MTSIRESLLWLMIAALLSVPLSALADLAPMPVFGAGGVAAPAQPHQTIRLDSQEVIIRLKKGTYVVEATFNLFNTGDATTEWIGFPKWVPYGHEAYRRHSHPTFGPVKFEGFVNGREIQFQYERDVSTDESLFKNTLPSVQLVPPDGPSRSERVWHVSQITFPGHVRTSIRVKYEAPYRDGHENASYFFGTGLLWKDNIGNAVFIVDSSEVGGNAEIRTKFENGSGSWQISRNVEPAPRPIGDNMLTYELTDFEPHPEALFHVELLREEFRYLPGVFPPPMAPPPPAPVRIKR